MIPVELRSLPLVFVEDLMAPVMAEADHRHLTRSLRLREGDPVVVSDGQGGWRSAAMGGGPEPRELGPLRHREGTEPSLTVGFAVVKGDRPELIVQKLTELGVNTIIPVTTERTVVRWDRSRIDKNLLRHRRVAREAAMQSRNVWLPDVWPLTPLTDVVQRYPTVSLAEPNAPMLGLRRANPPGAPHGDPADDPPTQVVVGPEGGFSVEELADRRRVGLPGNILRTETAAIAAGLLLVLTASLG